MTRNFAVRMLPGLALAAVVACTDPVTVSKPQAPTGLAAAAVSSTSIVLSWTDRSGGKASFNIERSATSNSGFALVATHAAGATGWTDTSLAASTAYYYRVAAVVGSLVSDYSAVATATTTSGGGGGGTVTAPNPPSNVTATGSGTTQMTITWTDNSANETGFDVMRVTSLTDANPVFLTRDSPLGAGVTSFVDSGLAAATDYGYVVAAYNAAGTSDLSNLAWGTTLSASSISAPTGILASQGTFKTMIYVDWSPVSGASGYRCYEAWALDSSFAFLGQSTASHAWINNSTSGVHDFFRVSAVDSSSQSSARSATVEGWAGTEQFNEGFEAGRVQGYWFQRQTSSYTQAAYSLASPGRSGSGYCLRLSGGTGTFLDYPGLSADTNVAGVPTSVGFWVKTVFSSATRDTMRFGVYDSTKGASTRTIYLAMTSAGKIAAYDFDSTAKGNVSYVSGTWYHLEARNIDFAGARDSDSSTHGTYDLYVNGTLAASKITFYYDASNMEYFDFFLYDANAVVYCDDIVVE